MEILLQSSVHHYLFRNIVDKIREKPRDMKIITSDGEVSVSRDIFLLASPFLSDLLSFQDGTSSTLIIPNTSVFAIKSLERFFFNPLKISFSSDISPSKELLNNILDVSSSLGINNKALKDAIKKYESERYLNEIRNKIKFESQENYSEENSLTAKEKKFILNVKVPPIEKSDLSQPSPHKTKNSTDEDRIMVEDGAKRVRRDGNVSKCVEETLDKEHLSLDTDAIASLANHPTKPTSKSNLEQSRKIIGSRGNEKISNASKAILKENSKSKKTILKMTEKNINSILSQRNIREESKKDVNKKEFTESESLKTDANFNNIETAESSPSKTGDKSKLSINTPNLRLLVMGGNQLISINDSIEKHLRNKDLAFHIEAKKDLKIVEVSQFLDCYLEKSLSFEDKIHVILVDWNYLDNDVKTTLDLVRKMNYKLHSRCKKLHGESRKSGHRCTYQIFQPLLLPSESWNYKLCQWPSPASHTNSASNFRNWADLCTGLSEEAFIFFHHSETVLHWDSPRVLNSFEGGNSHEVLKTFKLCKILKGPAKTRLQLLIISKLGHLIGRSMKYSGKQEC